MMKAVSIALCLIALSSCKKEDGDIIYTVTCERCEATYVDAGESLQQREVMGIWRSEFVAKPGQFLALKAENKQGSGSVTVDIALNRKVLDSSTNSAPFGIAAASGKVPD